MFYRIIREKSKCFATRCSISVMKCRHYIAFFVFLALLAGCDNGPIHSSWRPVLPEIPENWKEILGEPHWCLEWIGEGGNWQKWEGPPGSLPPGLSLPNEWTTPVLAWPFWPEWDLIPGMMHPSGALFPWDCSGDKLNLSWRGGVEASFWKALAAAERTTAVSEDRLPWYFDWKRFRELLESENVPETIREDPWLADWKEIGRKTVMSGFDRRRIIPQKLTEITVPDLDGLWVGSSPFAPPLDAPGGGPLIIMAFEVPNTWVSAAGVLRCSTSGWVYRPK